MKAFPTKAGVALLAVAGLLALSGTPGWGGQEFHGLVLDVTVDKCGGTPGTCQGSVVIGFCEAGVIRVQVEPGSTTIKRGGQELALRELTYGDKVLAELVNPLPPEDTPGYERQAGLATVIEVR